MILVTGGIASGKRTFARGLGFDEAGIACVPDAPSGDMPSIDELCGQPVVVCSEVGCGIVPMDRDQRAWRERHGRLACELAERADVVVRMVCGIPVCLKGDMPGDEGARGA